MQWLIPFDTVRGVKMTIPLRREKATSDCGELYIELDDLQISMGDITGNSPTSNTSADSRTLNSVRPDSNHVATTSGMATSETVAGSNSSTLDVNNLLPLMSLDTPEPNRRGQELDVGTASRGSSGQPSPSTTPTPTGAGGRGGVAAVAAVASTVGVTSVGASGGTGGGRGSGTDLPAPSSQSQQSIRSRTSSNQRPSRSPVPSSSSSSSSQPTPANRSQRTIIVPPQQQTAGTVGYHS